MICKVYTLKSAEIIALEEIKVVCGESVIQPPMPLTIEWIRDYSGCIDAVFIDVSTVKVLLIDNNELPNCLKVKTIISFNGLCIVEEYDVEDDWLMGQITKDGDILCWGYYGTLTDAIDGL